MSRFLVFCKGCLVVYRVVVLVLLAGVAYGLYCVSQSLQQSLVSSWGIESRLDGVDSQLSDLERKVPSSYSIESAVERAVPSIQSIESAVRDASPSTYGIESKLEEILDKVESIYYHVL